MQVFPANVCGGSERAVNVSRIISELKECRLSKNLDRGRQCHEVAIKFGYDSEVSVANTLISMYARCGDLIHAHNLFEKMQSRTVISWNTMILGYAENGEDETAFDMLVSMRSEGYTPDARTFLAILKACTVQAHVNASVERGKAVHLLAVVGGCGSNIFVESALVDMYAKCCSVEDARLVFEKMTKRNVVSWNALIYGYADNGQADRALVLFSRMVLEDCAPNARTCVASLKACTVLGCVELGKQIHLLASSNGWDSDIYVASTLVDMYAKCGSLIDAQKVFSNSSYWSIASWTALIFGYADNGESHLALQMFSKMRLEKFEPNSWTFVAVLKACSDLAQKDEDRNEVHEKGKVLQVLASFAGCDSNIYVQNTLVDLYSKCRRMEDAHKVFDNLQHPDVVSWNALVLGYAENHQPATALHLFSRMGLERWEPDATTFISILVIFDDLPLKENMDVGQVIHLLASTTGCDSDSQVQSALVKIYSKACHMLEARRVFDSMTNPGMPSWNPLMLGYAENGQAGLVLELFVRLEREGRRQADANTFAAVFKACGLLGALESGRAVHAAIRDRGLENDLVTCLVEFYIKCGSIIEAVSLFDMHSSNSDLVTWNALMEGYSCLGDNQSVFDLFKRMQDMDLEPNVVTLGILLTACKHAGLVERGMKCFELMTTKYGITPNFVHYSCMINMLARGNKLEDAMRLSRNMPFNPDVLTWKTLLEASRKRKNVVLAKLASECLTRLDESIKD